MRFARRSRDSWELRSGEQAQKEHPETFWTPDEAARRGLRIGQAARLIFDIEVEEDGRVVVQGERMWVIVSEVGEGYYVGILDNQPASYAFTERTYLKFGAEVPFGPQHIIDIADPPKEYVEWQLGQPPETQWYGRNDGESS